MVATLYLFGVSTSRMDKLVRVLGIARGERTHLLTPPLRAVSYRRLARRSSSGNGSWWTTTSSRFARVRLV